MVLQVSSLDGRWFASYPLMIAAMSVPFLGERVGWRRWLAVPLALSESPLLLTHKPHFQPSNHSTSSGCGPILQHPRALRGEDSAETTFSGPAWLGQ